MNSVTYATASSGLLIDRLVFSLCTLLMYRQPPTAFTSNPGNDLYVYTPPISGSLAKALGSATDHPCCANFLTVFESERRIRAYNLHQGEDRPLRRSADQGWSGAQPLPLG